MTDHRVPPVDELTIHVTGSILQAVDYLAERGGPDALTTLRDLWVHLAAIRRAKAMTYPDGFRQAQRDQMQMLEQLTQHIREAVPDRALQRRLLATTDSIAADYTRQAWTSRTRPEESEDPTT